MFLLLSGKSIDIIDFPAIVKLIEDYTENQLVLSHRPNDMF